MVRAIPRARTVRDCTFSLTPGRSHAGAARQRTASWGKRRSRRPHAAFRRPRYTRREELECFSESSLFLQKRSAATVPLASKQDGQAQVPKILERRGKRF